MLSAIAASLALAAPNGSIRTALGPSLSACAWGKAPPAVHRDLLTAYAKDPNAGMAVLSRHDAELQLGFRACVHRSDSPQLWAKAALGSQAIQEGASAGLAASRGLTRAQLDAAWVAAPAGARDCLRANASKVFFPTPRGACPDPNAAGWFGKHFSIPEADDADATRLIYYFNAKAQSEWVDGLLIRLKATPAKRP